MHGLFVSLSHDTLYGWQVLSSDCRDVRNAVLPDIIAVPAGSYDRFLNLQIALIIGMQLLMCLFCSVASYIWREHSGKQRYYLGMTEYVQVKPAVSFCYC